MSSADPSQPGRFPQQPPRYAAPAPSRYPQQYAPPPQASERVNVLGLVALGILVLLALWSVFMPVVQWQIMRSATSMALFTAISAVYALLTVIALGLALGGVLQKGATRLRWTAVGALVAASLSLFSTLGSTLTGLLLPTLAGSAW